MDSIREHSALCWRMRMDTSAIAIRRAGMWPSEINRDMMKFAIAMIESGQAVWWNVAFQFLRVYHFLFCRISHGATRLQEVLADRVAAGK